MRLKLFFVTLALFVGFGSWGQGILSSPIFSENFGNLSDATILTTSNTNFSFIRVGTSTTANSIVNEIIAKNPSSFTASSGLIGAKGTSISTVDKTGLTSFSSGTFTFKFKTPSTLTSAVMFSGVGTGASFGSASGFAGAQLSSAFQVNGTNLQIRSAGAWTTATAVATSTTYTVVIVFNNTAGSLSYGNGNVLASNKCDLWIDGVLIGTYSTATASLAASAFRIYTTTSEFEVDDISVYNSLPTASGPTSVKSGDWNDSTVWSTGSVPANTDNVTIASGHTVYTSSALNRTGTTTVNGSFQLNTGGWASGTNFTYGAAGSLNFNSSSPYDIYNGDVYWPTTNGPYNVSVLQGGITLNSANRTVAGTFQTASGVNLSFSTLTLNGTAQINAGGFFNQLPIYGASSTLIYNTGGTYGRGNEWQALGVGTIGTTPGYPNNVQLTGNTTLNYNNGTPLAKAIAGNLTIDSGSSFYMDYDGGASGGTLTIAGNVTNNGNFTLGNASGDDLKLGGNFVNTGTFNGNNRAIFFTKNGTQTISSVPALTIPYVVFQPVSGNTTVQLLSDITVSAPNTGNAISFSSVADVFDLNSKTLTIGTAAVANTISGSGTFKGSTTSNLTLLGTGSIGIISFKTSFQDLGTFTMNRQAATAGCTMGSAVTINTALNLTNGLITLGNFDMTLGLTATHSGSANGFVISDSDVGAGRLTKKVNSLGAYTLHIGDNTAPNGAQYAPATINFSSGTFSANAYYGVQVKDAIHPNIDSPTDYLTKYWIITSSGTFTTPVYSFTGLYTSGTADVNGTESNCISAKWDGTKWTNGAAISGGSLTISGLTEMGTSTTNEISAGNRNREINIKGLTGGTNNVVSGSGTANGLNNTLFPQTNLGSSSTKDYEIQNLGIAALNLTGTPIVSIGGANPGDFTVTTVPSSTAIVGGASTTFVITFSPTYAGIRTAVVSIANDDSDENPYTFLIQGTGICPATTNTITPTSGPVGTEVTINATANDLTGVTVTFNGVAATSITYVSSTQIKVIVPAGATSGNIVTTNATGCQAANAFTVIDNKANTCQGGSTATDLFISEVTDATTGGLSYIEIYNGTSSAINMNGYSLKTYSNGDTLSPNTLSLNNFLLNPGSIYVVAIGTTSSPDTFNTCSISGGNGSLANQSSTSAGVNFDTGNNDYIGLYKNSTSSIIDSFGTFGSATWADGLGLGDRGATFRRKNTATFPNTTYSNSDWNITDWAGTAQASCNTNDYSDIGTYNFISGTPPVVTSHPSYTPTCKSTSLTVAGTEGYAGGNSLAYQWLVSAPGATGWTEITDGVNYSGANTATLSIANISGVIDYQYYCQIRENTNTCYTASNAVKITDGGTTTWIASGSWTNGVPTLDKMAIIDNDYDTSFYGSFSACSVVVNTGKTLTITADEFVKIKNDLTNNGTLDVENNGSIVQINDSGVNTGSISYERITPPVFRTDYTYWSSPVSPQTLFDVSPTTLAGMFYSFNDAIQDWVQESSSNNMIAGKGYIIRGPETPFQNPYTAYFDGVPNNGVYTISGVDVDRSYLIGNPYPSALDADSFLNANAGVLDGTLYFWTHKTPIGIGVSNPGTGLYAYSQDDYASYNTTGGTKAVSGGEIPTGKIASGQGFFASSNVSSLTGNTIIFNNSMRVGVGGNTGNNSQFFKTRAPKTKTAAIEKHRIWLNLTNTQGAFKQTLIGYITDATNEYDSRFDGVSFDGNEFVDFYSMNQDKNLVIQGRALPFNENDEIPLGYRSAIEGDFTINIDQTDGLLTNQEVFIEDKLTNTIFDLRSGNYTFKTAIGTFNDRFILRYTNKTLGNKDFETLENQVLVSNKNKQIKINSAVEIIDKVFVYDLAGRQIFKKEKVSGNELIISNLASGQQTLLVKVSLQNGQIVTKKIVY